MKAFQLKITIKHSHPPIWRRIIVPEGITFYQLGKIFVTAMGWEGYHMFDFEISKEKIRICDNAQNFGGWGSKYIYEEMDETVITSYLENNKKLIYTYDLGDNWEHTVSVEKIIEDYEYDYPQVIKYKGNCPTEDCGGIFGYYRKMQILNDPKDPDYGELMEWCGGELSEEYDIDKVNNQLKIYDSSYKCSSANEYSDDIYDGEYGYFDEDERFINENLEVAFADFSKDELAELIERKSLNIATHKNKNTLIKALIDYMLNPEVFRSYLVCLLDEEIEEFEQSCCEEGLHFVENIENLEELLYWGYVVNVTDGRTIVPADVREAYNSLKGKELDEDRKKISYVLLCLKAATVLYGVTPMSILMKLIKQNPDIHVDEKDIETIIENLPPEVDEYFIKDDKIYVEGLYDKTETILESQKGKDYYIPSLEEIYEYGRYGYDRNIKEAKELIMSLIYDIDLIEEEAIVVAGLIQMQLISGTKVEEITKFVDDMKICPPSEDAGKKLIAAIHKLWLNSRKIYNRGYKDIEIYKEEEIIASIIKEYNKSNIGDENNSNIGYNAGDSENKVIDFAQAKKGKIYPNDPCPCGSGKKYKNCCRNKK